MYPWIIEFPSLEDPRNGIKVRHVISGNDGDVCISCVTHSILSKRTNEKLRCLDIGVDEGWWTYFILDHFPNAVLDLFEPNPESYTHILPYVEDDPRVTLHNIALSDTVGFLPFTKQQGQSHSRCSENPELYVPCERIDRYIGDSIIDLIKIDTEGHDLIILKTLYPYLHRINAIIFECTTYWNGTDKIDCISKTIEVLEHLKQEYQYMYMLSRRNAPSLTEFIDLQDIEDFALSHYESLCQVDIVVSRDPISLSNLL